MLQHLGVSASCNYTLAGLRPGGATWEYLNGTPIGNLKFRGRWAAEGSLEHYVQECVAFLDFQDLSVACRQRLEKLEIMFHKLIPQYVQTLHQDEALPSHPPAHA